MAAGFLYGIGVKIKDEEGAIAETFVTKS